MSFTSNSESSSQPSPACPICGTTTLQKLYITYFPTKPVMYQCPKDRHCFTYPSPSWSDLDALYTDEYTHTQAWTKKNQVLSLDYWNKIKQFLPKNSFRFLEVGGAYGYFCALVRDKKQAIVSMIEPGKTASQYAQEHFHVESYTGMLESFKTQTPFDVIFAGHVIEHIYDLDSFSNHLFNLLAPGGLLILLTPNASAWRFSRQKSKWSWTAPDQHSMFFSVESARIYFKQFGEVVAARSLTPHFFHYPFYIALRLAYYYGKFTRCSPFEIADTSLRAQFGRLLQRIADRLEYALVCLRDLFFGQREELLIVVKKHASA